MSHLGASFSHLAFKARRHGESNEKREGETFDEKAQRLAELAVQFTETDQEEGW